MQSHFTVHCTLMLPKVRCNSSNPFCYWCLWEFFKKYNNLKATRRIAVQWHVLFVMSCLFYRRMYTECFLTVYTQLSCWYSAFWIVKPRLQYFFRTSCQTGNDISLSLLLNRALLFYCFNVRFLTKQYKLL